MELDRVQLVRVAGQWLDDQPGAHRHARRAEVVEALLSSV
jgi:hypothetical protein